MADNEMQDSGTPEQTRQRCQTNVSVDPEPVNLIHGHSYRAQRADTVRRRAGNPSPAARGAGRREVFNQPPLSAQRNMGGVKKVYDHLRWVTPLSGRYFGISGTR